MRSYVRSPNTPRPSGASLRGMAVAHMADGGDLSNKLVNSPVGQALRRWMTGAPNPTRTTPDAQPASAPVAPQTMPAAPMPAVAPIEDPTIRPTPPGFQFQDGGGVPGTGKGDKIPAMYEPGEFVVSNDMLRKNPGLRGQLHELRADVLADKGMTPAEADANALRRGGLRARTGYEDQIPTDGYPPAPSTGGYDAQLNPNGADHGATSQAVDGAGPASAGAGASGGVLRAGVSDPRTPATSDVGGVFPGARMVGRGFVEDLGSLRDNKNLTGPVKLGKGLKELGRATIAMPAAIIDDLVGSPIAKGKSDDTTLQDLARGAVNTVGAAVTGNDAPLLPSSSTGSRAPNAVAPKPTTVTPAAPSLRQPAGPLLIGPTESGPASITGDGGPQSEEGRLAQGRYAFTQMKTAGDQMEKDRLTMEEAGRANQDAASAFNERTGQIDDNRTRRWNAEVEMSKTGGDRQERMLRRTLAGQTLRGLDASENQRDALQSQERTSLRTAQAGRDAGLLSAMVQMRGQDMTSATARASGAREQMNKDREFAAGRSDKSFEQNQAGKKAVDDEIDKMFVTPDGKPDAATASQYKQFMTNGMASQAERLKASKNPEEQALGKRLAKMSYADLDPEDRAALNQLWQLRAMVREKDGMLPTTAGYVDSLNPDDFVAGGIDKRTFGGDHIKLRNGSHISVNDLTGRGLGGLTGATSSTFDRTLRRVPQ